MSSSFGFQDHNTSPSCLVLIAGRIPNTSVSNNFKRERKGRTNWKRKVTFKMELPVNKYSSIHPLSCIMESF